MDPVAEVDIDVRKTEDGRSTTVTCCGNCGGELTEEAKAQPLSSCRAGRGFPCGRVSS